LYNRIAIVVTMNTRNPSLGSTILVLSDCRYYLQKSN